MLKHLPIIGDLRIRFGLRPAKEVGLAPLDQTYASLSDGFSPNRGILPQTLCLCKLSGGICITTKNGTLPYIVKATAGDPLVLQRLGHRRRGEGDRRDARGRVLVHDRRVQRRDVGGGGDGRDGLRLRGTLLDQLEQGFVLLLDLGLRRVDLKSPLCAGGEGSISRTIIFHCVFLLLR